MALGGEVHHRARLVLGKQTIEQRAVADVAVDEDVARIALQGGQGFEVAGVSQRVEVEHRLVAGGQPVEHEVRADESGAACHEDHCVVPVLIGKGELWHPESGADRTRDRGRVIRDT